MTKRKKKPSQQSQQKVLAAQHKNEFLRKFNLLCDDLCSESGVYFLIPKKQIDILYLLRFQQARVMFGAGQDIPLFIQKESKLIISDLLKKHTFKYHEESPDMSLNDYLTVGLTFKMYMETIHEDENFKEEDLELFPPLSFLEEVNNEAMERLDETANYIAKAYSNFGSFIYHLKVDRKKELEKTPGYCVCLEFYSFKPEVKQIKLDGSNRPFIRIGWLEHKPTTHLEGVKVTPADLGIQSTFSQLPMDVYVQSHAIDRMQERLDCVMTGILHYELYNTFVTKKVYKSPNGELLFEYRLWDKKVGYLSGEIFEGQIIIRTFLFITNDGTPEAEMLRKNMKLEKEDKIYWEIDKLETWMNSDIFGNEKLKEIFIASGCGDLFELDKQFEYRKHEVKIKSIADHLVDYLGLRV